MNDEQLIWEAYNEIAFDWDSLNFKHSEDETHNRLDFYNKSGAVGFIEWSKDDGEVDKIHVGKPYRRKGIGTHIWETAVDWANENDQIEPQHSSRRSYEGEQFAKNIGGYLPKLKDDITGWSNE